MGEIASPVCLQLAKQLKRAPRQIAEEIRAEIAPIEGIARIEVAGAGYLNAFLDRAAFWREALRESAPGKASAAPKQPGKVIVEHTSINPNKAAHIGHVRNAVLGDTMARILRYAGNSVQIQNYIDNTGVQVADVVIGFLRMEQRTPVSVKMLAMEPKFDHLCWDLYAKATTYFAEDKARAAEWRTATLKAIEEGRGEDAEVAEVVADAIVGCHLRTMARLDIHYELLARESEILHLKFWDAAFAKLKQSGAIQLAATGKMAGCWIMPWKEEAKEGKELEEAEEHSTEEDANTQDKIIVRSNGTVTYVGKDIAYQLWKFGLLGKDFHYAKWPNAPEGRTVWATTSGPGDPAAPHFGDPAKKVYNVIDSRQAYLQDVVAAGLRGRDGLRVVAGRGQATIRRSKWPQRPRRQGRRPARQARNGHARRGRPTPSRNERRGKRSDGSCHRHRRAALFSIEIYALDHYRLRFQRRSQLRRRNGTLLPICDCEGSRNPQEGTGGAGLGIESARTSRCCQFAQGRGRR